MGVAECEGCEKCGTTLDELPAHHRKPAPHEWKEEWTIDPVTGVKGKRRICLNCYKIEVLEFKED